MMWNRIASGLFATFVLAGMSYADLPLIPQADSLSPANQVLPDSCGDFESMVTASLTACHGLGGRPLAPPAFDGQAVEKMNPPRVLADRQNGMHLCFYTLLSLGLCKSVPWVRKLSLGVIPGWYHEGGPFQIGHSSAIGPDCLNSARICFIQPECRDETSARRYRREMVPSLWPKLHFSPTVLAARGPPGRALGDRLAHA